ncbi:uncharacterized protein LOC134270646 [Saccostrea cucullata]|uniref:uncharacterized protein LOC134270646 n=1 Tax=Saccostrea cuccullata TaxID=36930 RepID=UPI002ED4D0A4
MADKQGKPPKEHDCRKNWTGSSKGMEPDMRVSMITELSESGLHVDALTMDDDATTIARVRSEVDGSIKKISDKNHTVKHFTNKLYKLRTEKGYKQLNPRSIAHLGKCFTYAVSQNRGDGEATKKSIESIGPHVFGTHDLCDFNWCGYLKNPFTYKPKHLPYRKYFSGEEFKDDLFKTLQEFASQSSKLCNLGSTQANESLNNIIASKAPKSTFSSGSESNDFRVAAAIAQKNLGNQYIAQVHENLSLSPCSFTAKRASYIDNERVKKRKLEESVEYKRNESKRKKKR